MKLAHKATNGSKKECMQCYRKFAEKFVLHVLEADDEVHDREIKASFWCVDTKSIFHARSNFLPMSFIRKLYFQGQVFLRFCS